MANINLVLHTLLKGKDPEALSDVIELNNGTRIPSIILNIDGKEVQYFTGKSINLEMMPENSIHMLHLDNGTISIPFPVAEPDFAAF